MRLGQLARKLALRPAEISAFLLQHNIRIDEGANTRLEQDHVVLLLKQFAPTEINPAQFIEAEDNNEEFVDIEPREESTPVTLGIEAVEQDPITEVSPTKVIKAPKIELSGLKVLGKIELPEPKKKEPKSTTETESSPEKASSVEPSSKPGKQAFQRRTKPDNRPRKNPIALQREREAQEEKLKKQELAKREKEKRTEYYQRRMKSVPTKAAKLINEPVESLSAEELREPPKTLFGKFLRWLTT